MDVIAPAGLTNAVAPWRSRVFGVDVELDVPAPALPPDPAPTGGPTCRLLQTSEADLRASWPGGVGIGEMRNGDGSLAMFVEAHPDAGFLLTLPPFGVYQVSPDGAKVRCAPPPSPPWWWQRVLVGQVLPLVSLLQGHEVLHASALAVDGGAVLLCGQVGAGKSSLALRLIAAGFPLLAEDVAALRVSNGQVLVEPGATVVNLRDAEWAAMGGALLPSFSGDLLGVSDKTMVRLPRSPLPLPLTGVYVLEPTRGTGVHISKALSPSFADLAGWTFVPYVASAASTVLHLDVAAAIAAGVPVHDVQNDHDLGSAQVARDLARHLRNENP